jgi:uncharacterized repeat protein (TIGR03803 family)
LYGSTTKGSANGSGSIFATTQDGVIYLQWNSFYPQTLVFGQFGALSNGDLLAPVYDSKPQAGASPAPGSIVRIHPDGTTVFSTPLNPAIDGSQAKVPLCETPDLNAYGTAPEGGASNLGTIFRVTPAGAINVVHTFSGPDGSEPESSLVLASDGDLYGTTKTGGANDYGTVFRLTTGGQFTTILSFTGADGSYPAGGLTVGPDGNLYGTTDTGGTADRGTFYRITLQGQLTTLASFSDATGAYPRTGVTLARDNYFYGTTSSGGDYSHGTAYRVSAAGSITNLGSFGFNPEGFSPAHGVIQGSDGYLYGVTSLGGANNRGAVFRVAPGGKLTTLASLDETTTGANPTRIVQAADGNLYGATMYGGTGEQGAVFRVRTDGQLDVIASLTPQSGQNASDFVLGKDGNLYGLAAVSDQSCSTIFRATPSGALSRFSALGFSAILGYGGFDFTQDSDGTFFGSAGNADQHSTGIAFRVSANGSQTSIMATFDDFEHGWYPHDGLTKGVDGNYYGGTERGGLNDSGIIFRITPDGARTTIASLSDYGLYGSYTRLLAMNDGSFYGTSSTLQNTGTIFRVSAAGITDKYPVSDGSHGVTLPDGLMIIASDGYIYGTISEGGTAAGGVLYRFTSSKPQLSAVDHTAATVGSSVVLTGRYLAGASAVAFGGVSTSKFTINTSEQITVVVPPGAKAGPVTVTNPLGVGTSSFTFTPQPEPARLVNISTRLQVLNGGNVLIGGFIVTGTEPKKVLLRGVGPSLQNAGVSGFLADPTLELNDKGLAIAVNDNWQDTQKAEIEASGAAPTDPAESAMVKTLQPGTYTVILRGKNQTTGIGLVEVYDLSPAADSRVANISTRGLVGSGNDVMIGGFIVGSSGGNTHVLVRAIGPSLAGIGNALQDPVLQLRDANGVLVLGNDNWKETQQTEIEATGVAPTDGRESALISPLSAGNYTAIVSGKSGSTGVALVEVYNLQ